MHIPDGFLDARTILVTGSATATIGGYAWTRFHGALADRAAPILGVMSAFIFASQMINFPIVMGTSGHLIGGTLAAIFLGPWGGLLCITVVLIVQCLLYQDGGLLALGANALNMGVIGSLAGYCVYIGARRVLASNNTGVIASAMFAAWTSVLLAAIACSLELAASGTHGLRPTLAAMLFLHVFIGVGEAIITGMTVAFVIKTRPDLLYQSSNKRRQLECITQVIVAGLAISLVVAVFVSPFASTAPDGLERVAGELGFASSATSTLTSAPFSDYAIPGLEAFELATAAAGLIGTLVVFAFAFLIGRTMSVTAREIPDATV